MKLFLKKILALFLTITFPAWIIPSMLVIGLVTSVIWIWELIVDIHTDVSKFVGADKNE